MSRTIRDKVGVPEEEADGFTQYDLTKMRPDDERLVAVGFPSIGCNSKYLLTTFAGSSPQRKANRRQLSTALVKDEVQVKKMYPEADSSFTTPKTA